MTVSWFRTNPEPDMRRDIEHERELEHERDAARQAESRRYESAPRRQWWRRFTRRRGERSAGS